MIVSRSEAQAVIDGIEARADVTTQPDKAVSAAKTLMGLFPVKAFNDPQIFATGLSALLAAYPPEFVHRICSPVDGIATKVKFTLTLAEVKEALEAERNKRLSILSVAKWTLREHDRREAEERDRRDKLSPKEVERRKRQVAALLAPKNMEHDEDARYLEAGCPAPAAILQPAGKEKTT